MKRAATAIVFILSSLLGVTFSTYLQADDRSPGTVCYLDLSVHASINEAGAFQSAFLKAAQGMGENCQAIDLRDSSVKRLLRFPGDNAKTRVVRCANPDERLLITATQLFHELVSPSTDKLPTAMTQVLSPCGDQNCAPKRCGSRMVCVRDKNCESRC